MTQLYWIRNSEHQRIESDGYVGVSEDAARRFKCHLKRNSAIPDDAWFEVIFEGTREECFQLELDLRPVQGMGWNRAIGGAQGFKKGFVHSLETKRKLRATWTDQRKVSAAQTRRLQNKMLIGQKRPSQSEAMSGNKNPMFGKTHSSETKQKISDSGKGKIPPNKQNLFCRICRERASESILKKYHNRCFKKVKP